MTHTREQIMAMSAERLRLAIAEAKGFRKLSIDGDYWWTKTPSERVLKVSIKGTPDWPTDIRAAWELVEEAGFVVGPEWTGGFDSVRCGWAVYPDWITAAHDVNSLDGSERALAIDKTIPLAASRAWLMWNNAK